MGPGLARSPGTPRLPRAEMQPREESPEWVWGSRPSVGRGVQGNTALSGRGSPDPGKSHPGACRSRTPVLGRTSSRARRGPRASEDKSMRVEPGMRGLQACRGGGVVASTAEGECTARAGWGARGVRKVLRCPQVRGRVGTGCARLGAQNGARISGLLCVSLENWESG
jgi:hypothetical protein